MKACHVLDENVLVQRGVSVLIKKLGAVDAKRFLSLAVNRREDSVKRHRRWQNGLDEKVFYNDVFAGK